MQTFSILSLFLLLFFFAPSIALNEDGSAECVGDGLTVNCRKHKEISHMITSLKRELYSLRVSQDPNCTVCWSAPCFNDGICVPLDVTHFRCDCPEDYAGSICQTHVECKPDSCGQNAECFVKNHQINCVCKQGFTGDPKIGCSLKTVEACMSGDPHYTTFDGQRYEYQGTCPYVFAVPCMQSLKAPYESFEVKAKNELTGPSSHVSVVNEVEVIMYGQKMHIDRSYNFYLNGIKTSMPFYYPNRSNPKISVTYSSSIVLISNDQYVSVTFSYGSLCVQIPDVPEFQGPDVLCGLAGNRDFDCRNDFRNRDGFVYSNVTSCSNRNLEFTELFGDTYITDDFLNLKPNADQCLTGAEVSNGSLTCDLIAAKKSCLPILEAVNGTGYFADCQGLGQSAIIELYNECVFDVCQSPESLCASFTYFVHTCQLQLPNTPLTWRHELGCPDIHCPLHGSPKPCATGCPLSCENPIYSPSCDKVCMEGCECEPGYVLDDVDPQNLKCVKLGECGCMDTQGNYHAADDHWLTDNCTVLNYCSNGTFYSEYKPCASDASCQIDQFRNYKCFCDNGYSGDGYICSDDDECEDPNTCSAGVGHGKCTNTPGSYYCTCDVYYQDGGNCDHYLPLRHCADLLVYHKKTIDGVYIIRPAYSVRGNPEYSEVEVYCDMTTENGGWTLMANDLKDLMSNKTFKEYEDGFGDPKIKELWLGLDFIHNMTNEMDTSLRVNLYHCAVRNKPERHTYCTYSQFKVLDSSTGFAVVIPYLCEGTEDNYDDGWIRWDSEVGPSFTAFDSPQGHCSQFFRNTGWWFDIESNCGAANLNGNRIDCINPPTSSQLEHYLKWNSNPMNQAQLYLRPSSFPNYDSTNILETTTQPSVFTSPWN